MGRTNVGSGYNAPSTVVPQRGKVAKDCSKSSSNQHWAVFHEDVARSYFPNDTRHVLPHSAALPVDSGSPSGNGDVLTGKPPRYNVNNSSPRFSVKGLNVIPYRERRENAVILSGAQNASCVGVPLDCTDGSPSKEVTPENSSTSAREKSQLIHADPADVLPNFMHAPRSRRAGPPFPRGSSARPRTRGL